MAKTIKHETRIQKEISEQHKKILKEFSEQSDEILIKLSKKYKLIIKSQIALQFIESKDIKQNKPRLLN